MLTAFFSQFAILLLILIYSYIAGLLYFKYIIRKESLIQSGNFFLSFAEKSVFGISIIVALIAVIKSEAGTTQSISLLLLLFFPLILKLDNLPAVLSIQKKQDGSWMKNSLLLVFISLFIFCFHFFIGFLPDHVFYAKLSSAIYKTGFENMSALYSDYQEPVGISLYHYTDLWLNGCTSYLFSLNSLFSLTHIVYPLFHLLGFLTILGFVYNRTLRGIKAFFVTSAIMYGSALLFFFILTPAEGHYIYWFYGLPDITAFKSIVIYPFLFWALYYFKENRWSGFILMLVFCSINYITTVFAIVGGMIPIGVYYLFQYRKSVEESRKNIAFMFLLCFSVLLIFLVRFMLNSDFSYETANRNAVHIINPIREYLINFPVYLKRFFNYFLRPFYLYPLASAGLIYVLIKKKVKTKKLIVYIISCFIAGAAFVSLFFSLYNSTQAISMIIPPFMVFVSFIVYQYLPEKKCVWFIMALFVTSLLNMTKVNSFNNGTLNLSSFESNLYNFADNQLKNQKWAFYAERPLYEWIYNDQIVCSPVLYSGATILPIEITPCFDKDFKKYCLDNPDYPLRKIQPVSDTNVNSVVNYLRDNDIKYVYIKNSKTANKLFLHCMKPLITEKEQGLWQLNK